MKSSQINLLSFDPEGDVTLVLEMRQDINSTAQNVQLPEANEVTPTD